MSLRQLKKLHHEEDIEPSFEPATDEKKPTNVFAFLEEETFENTPSEVLPVEAHNKNKITPRKPSGSKNNKARSSKNAMPIVAPVIPKNMPAIIPGNHVDTSLPDCMSIDRVLLNFENEERRRFNSVQQHHHHKRSLYKFVLIPPRPHFDSLLCRAGSSFDLSVIPQEGSMVRFVYGRKAKEAELALAEVAMSAASEAIYAHLREWPTHPNALLLLSISDRLSGRYSDALSRVELALGLVEHGAGVLFRPTFHTLSYSYYENRILFLLLFSYCELIGRRGTSLDSLINTLGCWHSALENAKLLVSLDAPQWNDPVGALFLIDFFALQAKEYKWVKDSLFLLYKKVYQEDQKPIQIDDFPHLAFSTALASYHLGQLDEANHLLREAILSFPELAQALVTQNAEAVHGSRDSTIAILQRLYYWRNGSHWKNPLILSWLLEIMDQLAQPNTVQVHFEFTPEQQLSVCRHAFLSNWESVEWSLPNWAKSEFDDVWAFDPYPPLSTLTDDHSLFKETQDKEDLQATWSITSWLSNILF